MNESIIFEKESFCEHCGDLEPYTAIYWEDDGVSWCLYCADANGDISEEDLLEAELKEKEFKRIYFKKRLDEL